MPCTGRERAIAECVRFAARGTANVPGTGGSVPETARSMRGQIGRAGSPSRPCSLRAPRRSAPTEGTAALHGAIDQCCRKTGERPCRRRCEIVPITAGSGCEDRTPEKTEALRTPNCSPPRRYGRARLEGICLQLPRIRQIFPRLSDPP